MCLIFTLVHDVSSMGAVVSAVAAIVATVVEVVEFIVDVVEVAFTVAETVQVVVDTVDYFVNGDSSQKGDQSDPQTQGTSQVGAEVQSTGIDPNRPELLGPADLDDYLERYLDIDY